MKRNIFGLLLIALVVVISSCTTVKKNPLMLSFDNEQGTPPYSQIKNEHYFPAFVQAIEYAKNDLDVIINNPDAPTFQNTIEAMEYNGDYLNKVAGVFYNMLGAHTNDTLQDISFKVSPLLTELNNYTLMNDKLFGKVKVVYENMQGLNDIEKKLTTDTYKAFARNGAELSAEDKLKFGEITKKLSELSLTFDKNNLAATNDYFLQITEGQLQGLPQFVIDMALEDAKAREIDGWIITLQGPSYGSFMKYSPDRKLKEELWKASASMCLEGEFDNTKIINEMVNLRLEKANLLGYDTHASYVLEENMSGSAKSVNSFLAELSDKSMKYAKRDVQNITRFAKKNGHIGVLQPWDFSYYSDKLMQEKYSISDEILKPYFQLDNVLDGVFSLSNKLFGINFSVNETAEPYQEDVKIYNVTDHNGKFLAVLYMDFFPRASKGQGAWMNTIRDQKIENGIEQRPLVTVVCNFTKPTENTPSLLTHYEVVTLLHEFGHALHGIFATGKYSSLSGTSVPRDFVELPSQLMENWAVEKDFLTLFAKHYQTGEVIPNELIEKIIAAKNYNAGYSNARQISLGLNDMAWHTITEKGEFDVEQFEMNAMSPVAVLPYISGTAMSPSFGHIFAGGYSAGYYSYKWAEVLEADAFQAFKESGIFSREMGDKFREDILSKGGNEDAMKIFVDFRGHEPQIDALFKKYGM